jgi:hypothetical protein
LSALTPHRAYFAVTLRRRVFTPSLGCPRIASSAALLLVLAIVMFIVALGDYLFQPIPVQ